MLVWNGNYTAKVRAMDAHVCDYLGEIGKHLCYNDAKPVEQAGHSAGAIRFFDNTYTQVGADFGPEGDLRAPDIHELNTPSNRFGETFIQDVYEVRAADLRPYRGSEKGYVLDGCFQEVEIRTRQVLFEWCAMDHVPLWETFTFLWDVGSENASIPIAGNGSFAAPWDFFHINAIARSDEGDYCISARHFDTILKVAGKPNVHGVDPGTVLWHLGGRHNDFKMDFNFSRQHTVRIHSTGPSETVISLFDNAYDGFTSTSSASSGKMIRIRNDTMEASLIAQYDIPGGGLAFSQGSLQVLDNGNVFIGWGNRNFFSEFTYQGELLYQANFSGGVESFRAWKFPWKGYPKHPPKVIAYAANCTSSPMYAYVSWNGATEVAAWRFYSSWGTHLGPWHEVGMFLKTDFETFANFSSAATSPEYGLYAPYVKVDGLDHNGVVLGTSNVAHTFVPKNSTVALDFGCNEIHCSAHWFRFDEQWSCGSTCRRSHMAGACAVVILVCFIEFLSWILSQYGWRFLSRSSRSAFYTDLRSEAVRLNSEKHSSDKQIDRFGPAFVRTARLRKTVHSNGDTATMRDFGQMATGFDNLLHLIGLRSSSSERMRSRGRSSTSNVIRRD